MNNDILKNKMTKLLEHKFVGKLFSDVNFLSRIRELNENKIVEPKIWKSKLYNIMENPDSSIFAKIVSYIIMLIIFISLLVYVIQTIY